MREVGINDFIFIIGYLGEKIKNYVEAKYPKIDKTFVTQEERLGSGHAIWTAREHIKDANEVFIFFGDIIIDADFHEIIKHPGSCLGIKKVNAPWNFGIVEYGRGGKIRSLSEKHKIPKSDLALVGIYKIKEVRRLFLL